MGWLRPWLTVLSPYSNSHIVIAFYSYLGDPSKGEEYLKQALKEKERHYKGKADPQVAFTLRSLANVLNELGKHSEAMWVL